MRDEFYYGLAKKNGVILQDCYGMILNFKRLEARFDEEGALDWNRKMEDLNRGTGAPI
jgi:hypothetical protein